MSRTLRYITGAPISRNVYLDAGKLPALEIIAPGNLSEAVRYCIQYAIERGAIEAATAQHTDKQRLARMLRAERAAESIYAAPLPTAAQAQQTAPAPLDAFAGWNDE